MQRNSNFFRLLFIAIAVLATTAYEISLPNSHLFSALAFGCIKGIALAFIVFLFESQVKNLSLKVFNTAVIGLVLGTAMGWAITNAMKTLFSLLALSNTSETFDFFALTAYLGSLYFGLVACQHASNSWWLNIPFIKLTPSQQTKNKDLVLDISALEDSRLLELARTGLLDDRLLLLSCVSKELYAGLNSSDETVKARYKKCLESLKNLEGMGHVRVRQEEAPAADGEELTKALIRIAKLAQHSILTADTHLKKAEADGVHVICLDTIPTSTTPCAQRGETLSIKIQRPGKEPKQGVGYLEDGTMVVVNGGGDYLGETIKTLVLSHKYSSSGRIIFCNALQEEEASSTTTPYYVPLSQRTDAVAATATRSVRRNIS